MSREINIVGAINETVASDIIGYTSVLREEIDQEMTQIIAHNSKVKENNYIAPEPLIVNITSPGGMVIYGNAIIDAIDSLGVPIITRVLGAALSMGQIIFTFGDYRIMENSSVLMYHGIGNNHQGTINKMEVDLEFDKVLENMGDNLIVQNTKITQEQLDYYKERSLNWYMSKSDAIENGTVTHDLRLDEVIDIAKKEWLELYKEAEKEEMKSNKTKVQTVVGDKVISEHIEDGPEVAPRF